MLAFFSCDAGLEPEHWQAMVRRAVQRSFTAITVDGDTSTNDTVLAFAAGEALISEHHAALEQGLTEAMQHLARAIARDGEGATCLIEVQVEGAEDEPSALTVARTVCGSSLVKTAVHGRDPNWGRIVAAAGRSGVVFNPEQVALDRSHQLMQGGQPLPFDRDGDAALREPTVKIRLQMGLAWSGVPGAATYPTVRAYQRRLHHLTLAAGRELRGFWSLGMCGDQRHANRQQDTPSAQVLGCSIAGGMLFLPGLWHDPPVGDVADQCRRPQQTRGVCVAGFPG